MKKEICGKREIMNILNLSEEEFIEYYEEGCLGTVEYVEERVILFIMDRDKGVYYKRYLHNGDYMTFLTLEEFEESYFG